MGHIPRIFACMKSKNEAVPMSCVQVALVLADSTVCSYRYYVIACVIMSYRVSLCHTVYHFVVLCAALSYCVSLCYIVCPHVIL